MLVDLEEFRKNPSILFDHSEKGDIDAATMLDQVAQQERVVVVPPRTTAERVAGTFRKNPSILFDHSEKGDIDAATMLDQVAQQERVVVVPPRTTAERVAGTHPSRPAQQQRSPQQNPRTDAPQRRTGQTADPQRRAGQQSDPRRAPSRDPQFGRSGAPVRARQSAAQQQRQNRNRSITIAVAVGQQSDPRRAPSRDPQFGRSGAPVRARQSAAQQQRQNRNRSITIAVAVCSAVAGVAILIFLVSLLNGGLFRNETKLTPVPNLIGKVYTELDRKQYPNIEIVQGDTAYSDKYEEGLIMDQKPKANEQIPIGSQVTVYVSMGEEKDELPAIARMQGMTKEVAQNYIDALNGDLVAKYEEIFDDKIPAGQVVKTDPADGTQLERGQTVVIYLSKGPDKVKVPNVIGKSRDQAEPAGQVVKTDPADGTQLERGQTVVIYLSKGPDKVKVPNVIGKSRDQAERLLNNNGFKNIRFETAVVIYLSKGPDKVKVPNVIGKSRDQAERLLNNNGFKNIRFETEESDQAKDTVTRLSVNVNEAVSLDTEIVVYLSKGPGELPALGPMQGMTQSVVQSYIDALKGNLVIKYEEIFDNNISAGQVVKTDPAAGTQLKRGQTIIVYMSKGPETAKVPDVIGKSRDQAELMLNNSGFKNIRFETEESDKEMNTVIRLSVSVNEAVNVIGKSRDQAELMLNNSGFKNIRFETEESDKEMNTVIRLSVSVNEAVSLDKEIVVYLSEGVARKRVPLVEGKTLDEARRILNDAGFKTITVIREADSMAKDKVIRQSIASGVEIEVTTEIVLYVSDGLQETTINRTINLPRDKSGQYKLSLILSGKVVVDDQVIQPGTASYKVKLTGKGSESLEIWVDGVLIRTEKVDFNG